MLPALKANGVALFAISYDPVATLSGFANEHGIGYPLLSDQGSHVMRKLGLINERVQEDHAVYGIGPAPHHVNLPYPGVFVLDETGRITHKRFHESYRERDGGTGLIAETLGIFGAGSGPAVDAEDEVVRVRASLDSPTYSMFQRLNLMLELTMAPGFHVYGEPIPKGYIALSVSVAPIDGLELHAVDWPSPHPISVEGLHETFWAHEGTIRGMLPFSFNASPGGGDHVIHAMLKYQACNATTCLPPEEVRVALPIREIAMVGRTLPTKAPTP